MSYAKTIKITKKKSVYVKKRDTDFLFFIEFFKKAQKVNFLAKMDIDKTDNSYYNSVKGKSRNKEDDNGREKTFGVIIDCNDGI